MQPSAPGARPHRPGMRFLLREVLGEPGTPPAAAARQPPAPALAHPAPNGSVRGRSLYLLIL